MNFDIDALIEKWQDVLEDADDWTTKNLTQEIIEDLEEVKRVRG